MSFKTYVLLDSLNSDAPIYQTLPEGKRIKITKMPFWSPFLRITYQDKNGIGKTIRYKSGATDANGNSVLDQREQIDKLKIDANEHFTTAERADTRFRNGVRVTGKKITQDYLEAYPAFDGFEGFCDEIPRPLYKLLDKEAESKVKNSDIRLRVKAANKVIELDLDSAQAMLIRLNGSFFETPNDLEECQNMLMEFIDDAEEGGLKAVLAEDSEINIDDKTTVLIGKLINANLLSFDKVDGKISKKGKDGKWIVIRDMSSEYSMDERKRLLSDFLNTTDGKPLKNDLENDLMELSHEDTWEADNYDEGKIGIQKKRMGRPPKNN